jgi:hypothetical protein
MDKGVLKSLGAYKKRYIATSILILLKWDLEFHVHTNASLLAMGALHCFIINNDVLYIMGHENKLRWYISTTKDQKVMKELLEGTTWGHFVIEITHKEVFNVGY